MDAQPPPKPAFSKKMDPEVRKRLDAFLKTKTTATPKILTVRNYGPIASMTLGDDWTDLGDFPNSDDKFHGGNIFRWHCYGLAEDGGTLVIHVLPESNADDKAKYYRDYVQAHSGAVDKSDYDKFRHLFGTGGNPRFVTIQSIEVGELGGKKVVALTTVQKEDGSREKTIYVSLSGDWKRAYEIGIGVGAEKDFAKALEKFDKALSTVVWSQDK